MSNRIMMPHCSTDAPTIDAFRCSNCGWTYALPQCKPYLVASVDADQACRRFDDHRCEDFDNAKRKMCLKTGLNDGGIIVRCSACDWVLAFRVSAPDLDRALQVSAEELFRQHRCAPST